MKKHLWSFLIFFISVQSFAQKATEPSLLWEISGKGIKSPSYLFGTYHLVGKNFLDTLKGVTASLDKAKTVVGEIPFENEAILAQKMMPFMLLKENTLDKIFSPAEFAEIDTFLRKKTGMQLGMLNALKPAAVQITMIAFIAPKDIGPDNPGIDGYLQEQGKAKGKQIIGFETIEEQAKLLFDMPIERQKELLLKTVRESDRMIKESQLLFDSYRAQDLQGIEKSFKGNTDYTVAEMDALLINRNKAWLQKMPAMLSNGSVFFAVGAAHLVGENGLISLLRKQGYKVKPVSAKF